MIVVLGRPALAAMPGAALVADDRDVEEPFETAGGTSGGDDVRSTGTEHFLAAAIAVAAAAAGARVELVGSVGDDPEGDSVVVELGRGGIGHAALLRDPAGRTPVLRVAVEAQGSPPRLDADDVRLGLGYLVDYRVLVLAEALSPEAEAVAVEAAQYHGATIIAVVPEGASVSELLAAAATVLEAPADPGSRFADVVGRFAASLDSGAEQRQAFADAVRTTGWEPTGG